MEIFRILPERLYHILINRLTDEEKIQFDWDSERSDNVIYPKQLSSSNKDKNKQWIMFEDKFKIVK